MTNPTPEKINGIQAPHLQVAVTEYICATISHDETNWNTICSGRGHGGEKHENRPEISSSLIDGDKLCDTGDANGLTKPSADTSDRLSADGDVHFMCCTHDDHTNDDKNDSKNCRVSSSDEIRD